MLELPVMTVLSAIAPAVLVSLVMCIVIYLVDMQFADASALVSLYKIPLGAVVYVVVSWLFFRRRSEELVRILFRLAGRS